MVLSSGPVCRAGGRELSKALFIKTWGCQMNVYDSARMADVLAPVGYRPVERAEDADMVILNTCHIREKAAEKVFSELGRLKALKRRKAAGGGRLIIAVAGCVGQAEGAEIMARAPYVDMVFGPQTFHRLPEMVAAEPRWKSCIDEFNLAQGKRCASSLSRTLLVHLAPSSIN